MGNEGSWNGERFIKSKNNVPLDKCIITDQERKDDQLHESATLIWRVSHEILYVSDQQRLELAGERSTFLICKVYWIICWLLILNFRIELLLSELEFFEVLLSHWSCIFLIFLKRWNLQHEKICRVHSFIDLDVNVFHVGDDLGCIFQEDLTPFMEDH